METYQKVFIEKISKAVIKYAPKYNIMVHSPIIAQAILESAFGKSKLATYNNFFGMKAQKGYRGQKVTFETREVIGGKNVTVNADFRCYKTAGAGIKGYFDFINTDRYKNLKGVTDPKTYLENIKADGYATDPNYVSSLMAVIDKYDLTQYDKAENKPATKPTVNKEKIDAFCIEKAIDIIADNVINNRSYWGDGIVRKARLYRAIQLRVNIICAGKDILKTFPDSIDGAINFVASDIIKNPSKWGSGEDRQDSIYNAVQSAINKKLKG